MGRLRVHCTYANVVATMALALTLTGAGAYAASQLAPRSVGEKQLRPGAVTAEKMRKNAVTAPKIKALAVKSGKLATGSVTAAKVAPGAVDQTALANSSVGNEAIAADAVTGDKLVEASLGTVPSASRAILAIEADSSNPQAFAAVDMEGVINTALSKGLEPVEVERKSAGVYCLLPRTFNPRGAQVTPRNVADGTVTAYVTIGGTEACPAPRVDVRTFKGGTPTSEPFYVVIYR